MKLFGRRKKGEVNARGKRALGDSPSTESSNYKSVQRAPPSMLKFDKKKQLLGNDDVSSIHESIPADNKRTSVMELNRLLQIPESDDASTAEAADRLQEHFKMQSMVFSTPTSKKKNKKREKMSPRGVIPAPESVSSASANASSINTATTTLPSGNVIAKKEANPLSSVIYLSLIMPTHQRGSDESRDSDQARIAAGEEIDCSTRQVIVESVLRNLNHLIENGERLAHYNSRASVPVRVDDGAALVGEYENALTVVDAVAQTRLLQHDFQGAFHVYESLWKEAERTNKNPVDGPKLSKKLLKRLSLASFLAGHKNKCIQFAKDALQKAEGDVKESLVAYIQLGLVQFGLEQYEKASISWREAAYKAGYNPGRSALLWNNIACLKYYLEDFEGADAALNECAALQKKATKDPMSLKRDLLNMSTTLSNLSVVSAKQNRYSEAVAYLEEGLLLQETVFDEGNAEVKATNERLLDLIEEEQYVKWKSLKSLNYYLDTAIPPPAPAEASPTWSDSDGLVLLRASSKADCLDYMHLGSLEYELGPYGRIREVLLQIFESSKDDSSLSRTDFKPTRSSMPVEIDGGAIYEAEHRLPEIYRQATEHIERDEVADAAELLKGVLRSLQRKYGTMHPLVAATLHNLGMIMMYAEKYNAALAYFHHTVNIRVATLGMEHPEVSESLTKIGLLQTSQKDNHAALETFSRVLRARRKAQGYSHPEAAKALNNIACTHFECNGLIAASKAIEEAVEILRKNAFYSGSGSKLNVDEPLAVTLCNMGFLLCKRNLFAEAESAYKEALELQIKVYGEGDPHHCQIVTTRENLDFASKEASKLVPVKQEEYGLTEAMLDMMSCV